MFDQDNYSKSFPDEKSDRDHRGGRWKWPIRKVEGDLFATDDAAHQEVLATIENEGIERL